MLLYCYLLPGCYAHVKKVYSISVSTPYWFKYERIHLTSESNGWVTLMVFKLQWIISVLIIKIYKEVFCNFAVFLWAVGSHPTTAHTVWHPDSKNHQGYIAVTGFLHRRFYFENWIWLCLTLVSAFLPCSFSCAAFIKRKNRFFIFHRAELQGCSTPGGTTSAAHNDHNEYVHSQIVVQVLIYPISSVLLTYLML